MHRIRLPWRPLGLIAVLVLVGPNAQGQRAASRAKLEITVPTLPANVAERHAKLSAGVKPVVRDWAKSEATSVAARNLDADATLAQIRRDVEARFGAQKPTAGAVNAMTLLVLTDVATSGQAKLRASKLQLDSQSEMGETESLRLQMAMDRVSKMMSTLSNLEKKMDDTDSGITQNLK